MWDAVHLVESAASGLRAEQLARRRDQSAYGLDSLSEVALHPLLRAGLAAAGWGVLSEQPYPTPPGRRARHRERERCDLVLTPDRAVRVRDVVEEVAVLDEAGQTLFSVAAREALAAEAAVAPDEAFWLEVKAIGQHCYTHGVPGPNRAYGSELASAAADLVKLSRDPAILHAGLLIVLFTEDQRIAEHDLGAFIHKCLDRDLSISTPSTARFDIDDRIGNRLCTVALVPLRPSAHGDRAV